MGPVSIFIVDGVIILFGVVIVVVFLLTEARKDKFAAWGESQPEVARQSYADRLKIKQQVLSDLIVDSEDPYIVSIDNRSTLTYRRFREFLNSGQADVSRFGVSGADRLAAILGNGPEAAVALFVFSAQCAFAPLSERCSAAEVDFTLRDLPAKAVLVRQHESHRVRASLPVIELTLDKTTVGLFTLKGILQPVQQPEKPNTTDTALVILTSGTTRKPKLVPLSHRNLLVNAFSNVAALQLEPEDCALSLLPLHRMSGLSCHVIATAASRSSVVCMPQFSAQDAFEHLEKLKPSWYSAGPTYHILMMQDNEPTRGAQPRFCRNSSAALLPSIAIELKEFFGCTVLPSYGMSECTPICSNQYGRLVRNFSVGPAASPEVITDLGGEILIRGPGVFERYDVRDHMEQDPNIAAFESGWFRTGDHGVIDADHYVSISGRSKEIINRGGEKISPLEVEAALSHASVSERVAFSVAHAELGETIGLAVKTSVPAEELGQLLVALRQNSLLDSRWHPEVIVKMNDLPLANSGRPRRIGLQMHLGLPSRSFAQPGPVAYTHSGGRLARAELSGEREVLQQLAEQQVADFRSAAKAPREVEVPEDHRDIVQAMLACCVFAAVTYIGTAYLNLPQDTQQVGTTVIHMMTGSIAGGMRWTAQAFAGCIAYLQCREPFNWKQMVALFLMYLMLRWPYVPIVEALAILISNEPPGTYAIAPLAMKRWFIGVMIFAQVTFAFARKLPCHGVQCVVLVIATVCLAIWQPHESALYDAMPFWINGPFETHLIGEAFLWSGVVTVYYVVGHYGHRFVARVTAHPWSSSDKIQLALRIVSPFLLLGILFAQFSTPMEADGLKGVSWGPWTLLVDQLSGLVIIALLSQSCRNVGPYLNFVGSRALGIYCGCNPALICPGWAYRIACFSHPVPLAGLNQALIGSSFGIVVRGVPVLPPLQFTLDHLEGMWPVQALCVFVYTCLQIVIFGIPFSWFYMKVVDCLELVTDKNKQ